jgi:hypothetical protein
LKATESLGGLGVEGGCVGREVGGKPVGDEVEFLVLVEEGHEAVVRGVALRHELGGDRGARIRLLHHVDHQARVSPRPFLLVAANDRRRHAGTAGTLDHVEPVVHREGREITRPLVPLLQPAHEGEVVAGQGGELEGTLKSIGVLAQIGIGADLLPELCDRSLMAQVASDEGVTRALVRPSHVEDVG